MSIESLMTETGTLYAQRKVYGANGVVSYIYNKIHDNIPCRSVHIHNVFGAAFGGKNSQATHNLFLSLDAPDVDISMRIEINNVVYAFEHIDVKYEMGQPHHVECLLYALESLQSSFGT